MEKLANTQLITIDPGRLAVEFTIVFCLVLLVLLLLFSLFEWIRGDQQ